MGKEIQLRLQAQERGKVIFKVVTDSRQHESLERKMKNIRVNEGKS